MKLLKEQFLSFIQNNAPSLTQEQSERAVLFAELLYEENEIQNLTRIVGVEEFFYGHLLDVLELLRAPGLGNKVLDLGSGCGVPGLLAAAIDLNQNRTWILVDSESNKAAFLIKTTLQMKLDRVLVFHDRVEDVIMDISPDTVIARAVGTVEKISNWIWNCSTWNNLILFKSVGWDNEWKEASLSRFGKKLTVTHVREYPAKDKQRKLITLKRK